MEEEACQQFYELLLVIQSLSFASKEMRENNCGEEFENFSKAVLCAFDPLLTEFVQMPNGPKTILDIHTGKHDVNELLLLLSFLTKIPTINGDTLHIWMYYDQDDGGKTNLLSLIFEVFNMYSADIFKNKMLFDRNLKDVSIYELTLSSFCIFCAALPAGPLVYLLESVLLSNLLSEHRYQSILASDVWCFISRWGTSEFCWKHILFLGKLLVTMCNNYVNERFISHVSLLFKRIFWFIPAEQHNMFTIEFPVCMTSTPLWAHVPVHHLQIEDKFQLCMEIVKTVLSLMQIGEDSKHSEQNVVYGIKSLCNLLSCSELSQQIPVEYKQRISKQVLEFWACFSEVKEDIEMNKSLMVVMLELTSCVIPMFESARILQSLSVIKDILIHSNDLAFEIECAGLLTNLRYIQFAEQVQDDCLSVISIMFLYLLSHNSCIVEHSAMDALRKYAEVTVYSHALTSFLPPSKKKDFAKFLKKVSCDIETMDVYKYLSSKRIADVNMNDKPIVNNYQTLATKQMLVNDENEVEFETTLHNVYENVEKLNRLSQAVNKLGSYDGKIQHIISSLQVTLQNSKDRNSKFSHVT